MGQPYEGYNGQVIVEGDALLVKREGLPAKLGGISGPPRRITLADVSDVYLKDATRLVNGYLQLCLGGAPRVELSAGTIASDSNTILFRHKDRAKFAELHFWLQEVVRQNRASRVHSSEGGVDGREAPIMPAFARSGNVEDLAAELGAVLEAHNARMAYASGGDGALDGKLELRSAKSVADETLSRLRDLKSRTVTAERELSAGYQEAHAEAASKQHFVLGVLGGRKLAGHARADTKRRLSADRSRAVAPYRQLKLAIDDAIRQATLAKRQIGSTLADDRQASAKDEGMASELSRLADLHRQGILTDDEFTAAKSRLLGTSGS